MNHKILALRKALVHYEECVDVNAAEHIIGFALTNISNICKDMQEICNQMIEAICE